MRNSFLGRNGKFIYYVGIIDYLQEYNWSKKVENTFKGLQFGRNKHLISAVPSLEYRDRFFNFMKDHVIINQTLGNFQKKDIRLDKQIQKMIKIKENVKEQDILTARGNK